MVPILVSTAVSVQQTINSYQRRSADSDDVRNESLVGRGWDRLPPVLPPDAVRLLPSPKRSSLRVATPTIPAEPWTSPIVQDWPEVAPSVVESSLHDGERLWAVTLPNQTQCVLIRGWQDHLVFRGCSKPPFGECT